MNQTREDRMWRHYKSLKKSAYREGFDTNQVWLTLARMWKMPVRAVKDIIAVRKGPTMEPVYCCEDHCFVESYREVTAEEQTARHQIARMKAAATRWKRTGVAYACDSCDAPVPTEGPALSFTGLAEAVHTGECPDLGATYLPEERWYETEVRRLRGVLSLWARVGGFYRCDACDGPVPTSGPDLAFTGLGEAVHAGDCPVPQGAPS